ncbi:MAG: SH3 domain-containing protein [Thermomicrobiales bacterium]|nr:SH3 domain-containing protein [Thermomicrobiales bacterium]
MPDEQSADLAITWQSLITNRRVLAKAGAVFGALALFDFTTGDAQNDETGPGSTRAVDWYEDTDPEAVIAADRDGFVTIATDFPFTAVGASWSGDVGTWPLVEIQISYDGVTFGDSIVLLADVDTDRDERDNRVFSRLLFTNGESVIRYRTTDQNGVPVGVPGFGLTYIDASSGPSLGDIELPVAGADITTPPAIISRAGWGADESLRFSNGVEVFPRQYAPVAHALVHHSETPNDSDPLQQMRSIYYFHAITRGWGDIGYNYLVDKFGNVYEGRVGGQNVIGNHSLAYNVGAAGICLIGNHSVAPPTSSAVSGLVGLLAWICRDLDPLGYSDSWDLLGLATIASHRDATGVACPGDYAYNQLPAIRTAVANTIASSPVSPPGGFVVGDLVAIDTKDGVPVNLRKSAGMNTQVITQLSDGMLGSITGNPAKVDAINWYPISTTIANGWIDSHYLEFQPPPLVAGAKFATWDVIAANRPAVVLLEVPVSSSAAVATIPIGTKRRVQAGPRFRGGKVWYHLYSIDNTSDTGGWGDQNDFVLSAQPPPNVMPAIGDLVTLSSSANFRTLPTLSASIIRLLPLGTEGTVIGGPRAANAYNWFQLQTAYGQGWTVVDYLRVSGAAQPTPTPVPGKFQPGDVVTNPSSLNLRSAPSTSGAVVALMAPGTMCIVLAGPTSANGYSWYQIQTSYGTGWSAGEFLSKSASTPVPTQQPTAQPTQSPTPSGGLPIGSTVKTTAALNMRSAASLSGSVLAVLPNGTSGTVLAGPTIASGYTWYRIQTSFGAGWVVSAYLTSSTPPAGIQVGSTVRTTTNLRLRVTASTSGTTITTMPTGTLGTVIGGPVSANGYTWWQLQTALGTGWAAAAYLAVA